MTAVHLASFRAFSRSMQFHSVGTKTLKHTCISPLLLGCRL